MKIKYNIPMINKIKENFRKAKGKTKLIKEKIKNNTKENNKSPIKNYAVLLLMVMLGLASLNFNIRNYNKSKQENFEKYDSNKIAKVNSNDISNSKEYETAISSISTNISNVQIQKESKNTNSENIYEDFKDEKCIMPLEGDIIKEFAIDKLIYSKTLDMWKIHPGIDIKTEIGTNVKAILSGRIIDVEKDNFYGNTVRIEHEGGYISIYSNLDNNIKVKKNDKIQKGKVIGKVGVSANGEILDECHLHFEILKNQEQINPIELLGTR